MHQPEDRRMKYEVTDPEFKDCYRIYRPNERREPFERHIGYFASYGDAREFCAKLPRKRT